MLCEASNERTGPMRSATLRHIRERTNAQTHANHLPPDRRRRRRGRERFTRVPACRVSPHRVEMSHPIAMTQCIRMAQFSLSFGMPRGMARHAMVRFHVDVRWTKGQLDLQRRLGPGFDSTIRSSASIR